MGGEESSIFAGHDIHRRKEGSAPQGDEETDVHMFEEPTFMHPFSGPSMFVPHLKPDALRAFALASMCRCMEEGMRRRRGEMYQRQA